MSYLSDVIFAILSTTLCLAVAFIFFALILYAFGRLERRKGNDMKLAQLEAIYSRWERDMDYTTLQAISDMGEILVKEAEE